MTWEIARKRIKESILEKNNQILSNPTKEEEDVEMLGDDTNYMDIGDVNIDGLEKAVQDPNKGIIPSYQLVILKEESFLNKVI